MSGQRHPSRRGPPRPPVAPAGRAKLPLPARGGLSRRARGELDFLRAAWSAAGEIARKSFLSDLMLPSCKREPRRPATVAEVDGSLLGEFLRKFVVDSPGDRIQSSAFYERYRRMCLSAKAEPISHTRFSRLLKARGYKKLHSNIVWWIGIKLVADGPK